MNPIETAKSYYEAWKAMDISKAAAYLAAEVTFDVPINFYHTKEDFIDALAYTAKAIKDVRLLAAYGDDESALLVYDME
ncbi:MAG TPA: nuclear transport factor 2 family protein, partial [Cytophagales bacterium]|nr:nuclear transport factor 2 family protein [Cytophagales bacterium]